MSAIIALDPNVLLAAANDELHSKHAIRLMYSIREELCLGLDPDNKIWDIYMSYKRVLSGNLVTKAFIKVFFEGKRTQVIAGARFQADELEWLRLNNCSEPVEPELICVGKNAPGDACILVLGDEVMIPDVAPRGTNAAKVIQDLHLHYRTIQIWKASEFDDKLSQIKRARYPGNEEQFRLWLRPCEDEFLEFKQPGENLSGVIHYRTHLTDSIKLAALKAACAMLNSCGGCVVVGVTPEAEVMGLEATCSWSTAGDPDDDKLLRRFSDMLDRFEPDANRYIKPAAIPLTNGRRVVLLHVSRGEAGVRYTFDDAETVAIYDRNGPENRRQFVRVSKRSLRYWEKERHCPSSSPRIQQ